MPADPAAEARARGGRIRSAAMTSLVSKGGNVLLQIVAVPIAIRVLGIEEFGVYATVASVLGFVHLMELGVGPGLTSSLAHLSARRDRAGERDHLVTAVVLVALLALVGVCVVGAVVHLVPVATLFGGGFAAHAETVRSGVRVALAIIFFDLVFGVFERARAGYQEIHISNLWGAAGNILGGVTLGVGIFVFPSIEFMILAVYGSGALARLLNGLELVLRRRRYLLPRAGSLRIGLAGGLLRDGAAFAVAQCIVPLTQREGCKLIVAHLAGPAAVGVFAVLIQLLIFMMGFVMMFSMPLWPAVSEAVVRGDRAWVRGAAKKMFAFVAGYCLVGGIALVALGPILIPMWLGVEVDLSRALLSAFMLYFAAMAWSHVGYFLLLGLRVFGAPAAIAAAEAVVLLGIAYLGMVAFGLPGLFGGMAASLWAISCWAFAAMFWRRLRDGAPAPPGPAAQPAAPAVLVEG